MNFFMKTTFLIFLSIFPMRLLIAADAPAKCVFHGVSLKRSSPSKENSNRHSPQLKKQAVEGLSLARTFTSPVRSNPHSKNRSRYLQHSAKKPSPKNSSQKKNKKKNGKELPTPDRIILSQKNHGANPESLYARLQNQLFQVVAPELLNPQLEAVKTVRAKLHLLTQNVKKRNKSIIAASFAILEIKTGKVLERYPIENEFYWSSKHSFPAANIVGLATPVCQEGQHPLNHNHSERNFFSHLHEDFRGMLEKANFGMEAFDPSSHIFAVALGNTYSSCPRCASFMGGKNEESTSLADNIAEDLKVQVELQDYASQGVPFHVLIFHQGLESHTEMRCSCKKRLSNSSSMDSSANSSTSSSTPSGEKSFTGDSTSEAEETSNVQKPSEPEIRPSHSMEKEYWKLLRNLIRATYPLKQLSLVRPSCAPLRVEKKPQIAPTEAPKMRVPLVQRESSAKTTLPELFVLYPLSEQDSEEDSDE